MMFYRVTLMAAAAAATVALSGCSTAPAPRKSEVPLASGFANAPQGDAAGLAQAPVGRFWQGFNDAELNALVDRSLQANTDLRIASANLREARALSRFADAQLFPSVNATAGAARVRA